MIGRVIGAALTVAACGGIWWAYENIDLLRGSFWWEYRYIILLSGAVLALSLLDSLLERIKALWSKIRR
ncbi:hypothetical protein AB0T83_13370 [Fluviibacterium sp. DFM31]|uniref:Uncharacterized protein n=1 Tax=Meridianimarinicoccus marinus TaxID=3231483 RepID=A0ABV3L862_9RHOB